jgi:CRP-like cAMP-binding protein
MNHAVSLSGTIKEPGLLSDEQIEDVCNQFSIEKLSRNDFFLEQDKRCNRIGFLSDGIICSYIQDSEGEMIVKHFVEPGMFFTDLDAYEKADAARLNLQAVVDSTVYYIHRDVYARLSQRMPEWQNTMNYFASKALKEMIMTQNFLHIGEAIDKYHHFVQHHPNLARQVPLKYVAAYLGITQSSLSRIRRNH